MTSDQTLKGSLDKHIKDVDDDESVEEQKTETNLNSPTRFSDFE